MNGLNFDIGLQTKDFPKLENINSSSIHVFERDENNYTLSIFY